MGGKKVFDGGVQFVTPLPISVPAQNGKFTREYAKALKSGIPNSVSIPESESSKSAGKAEDGVEAPKNRNPKRSELGAKTATVEKPIKQSSHKGASPNVPKQSKNAIENDKADKAANGAGILSSNPATSADEKLATVVADGSRSAENAKPNSDPSPKPPPVSELYNVQISNSDAYKPNPANPDANSADSPPLVSQPPVILDPNAKEFTPPVSIPHPGVFFQNHPYNVHAQPHPHPHAHGHAHPLPHTHPLPHPQMHFRGMEMQPIMYGPPESFTQGVIPVFAPGPQYPVMYTPLSPSPHPPMTHSTVPYAISQPSISSSVSNNPSIPVPSLPIPPVPFVPSPYPPTVGSSPASSPIPPAPYPLSSSPSPVLPVPLTPHGVVSPTVLPNPPETLQSSSVSSTDASTSATENPTNRADESPSEPTETAPHSNSSSTSSFLPSLSSSSSTSTTPADAQPPLVSSSPSPASGVQSPVFSPSVPMTPPFPLQPHFYDQSHVPVVLPHESNMQMVPPGNRMMVNHNGNFPMRPSYTSVRPVLPGLVPVFYPPLMPGQNYLGRENFSRILLLSNVPVDIPDDQFKTELETFGKIRYLDLDRKMEGIIIVHYFDLRDARKLYFEIQKKYNGNYANNNDYKYHSQHNNLNQSTAGNPMEGFEDSKEKRAPSELLTQDFDENFPEISSSKSKKKENEGSKPKTTELSIKVKSEETPKSKVEPLEKKSFLHFNVIAQFLFFINNTNKNMNINFQNQGTIVLFNVDSEISNDDLKKMFGEFGLIKEIREIVGKRQKFIEYFDTRDSERAMDFYDGKEINGKKIKIEFSKPSTNQKRRQNAIPSLNSYPLTSLNSYPPPSPSASLPFSPYSHESPPVHQHPRPLSSKKSEVGASDVDLANKNEERAWEDKNEDKDKRREKYVENRNRVAIEDGDRMELNGENFQSSMNKGESAKETGDQTNDDGNHTKSDGTVSDIKSEENFTMENRYDNFYSVPPAYALPNYPTYSQNGNFYTYTHPRQHYYYNPNHFVDGNQYGFPYSKFDDSQSDSSSKLESFSNRKSARVESKSFQSDGKNFRRKTFMNNRESDVQEEDHYLPRNPRHNPNSKKGFSNSDDLASQYTFDEFEVEFNDQKTPPRTTLMIKNIPNKYSQGMLLALLDSHCLKCNSQPLLPGESMSAYDFVYLPIDFKNRCNLGYAFVNFTSVEATLKLYRAFHAQQWEAFNSRKICQVTYARVQGRAALEEHFRNSRFACDTDEYLPLIFSPPRNGIICPPPIVAAGHLAGRTAGTSPSYASFRRNLANQTFSSGQSDAADSDEASEPVSSDSPCKISESSPLLENSVPEALKVAAF